MKKPRERGFSKNLTGPLEYAHAWVGAIAGGISARLAPFRSYANVLTIAIVWTVVSLILILPTLRARRYTQMLETRHFGLGCRNPASKDGKLWPTTLPK